MAAISEQKPGVWRIRVSAGSDPVTGHRRYVTETFHGSRTKARERAETIATEVRRNGAPTSRTLRQVIKAWRDQAPHEAGTARNYDLALKTIPRHFLDTSVGKVNAAGIRALVEKMHEQHGVSRARLVHALVSGGLTYAWQQEWIPTNPARRVRPPSQPKRKPTNPHRDEVRALLALVEADAEFHVWLRLSCDLGARRSDVLALHWSDIDLAKREVKITKALDPVAGGEKSTKTGNRRVVAIGDATVAALEVWRSAFLERAAKAGATLPPDPYVLTRDLAGAVPWRPDIATKRYSRLRASAKIRQEVRLHDLRHYVASELLNAGVPIKTVADRLGHTRVATTTDLYGHTEAASDRDAADILERLNG